MRNPDRRRVDDCQGYHGTYLNLIYSRYISANRHNYKRRGTQLYFCVPSFHIFSVRKREEVVIHALRIINLDINKYTSDLRFPEYNKTTQLNILYLCDNTSNRAYDLKECISASERPFHNITLHQEPASNHTANRPRVQALLTDELYPERSPAHVAPFHSVGHESYWQDE